MSTDKFTIRAARRTDVSLILDFIKKLADYERLPHEVKANPEILEKSLFGSRSNARALLGYHNQKPVAFALYFLNFSTFLGKPGLFLEDLFVLPEERGKGFGKRMLVHLAEYAYRKGYGRFEWSVLDWNIDAINFYKNIGASAMEGWTTYRLSGDSLKYVAKLKKNKKV